MADISMCEGQGCPLKEKCYRFTAPKNEHWQAVFVFVPYNEELKECDMFYPIP
jgi:hypothetical protein